MIETVCDIGGCVTDFTRANPMESYYILSVALEAIIGIAITGIVMLKILFKYRKEFRYD